VCKRPGIKAMQLYQNTAGYFQTLLINYIRGGIRLNMLSKEKGIISLNATTPQRA